MLRGPIVVVPRFLGRQLKVFGYVMLKWFSECSASPLKHLELFGFHCRFQGLFRSSSEGYRTPSNHVSGLFEYPLNVLGPLVLVLKVLSMY